MKAILNPFTFLTIFFLSTFAVPLQAEPRSASSSTSTATSQKNTSEWRAAFKKAMAISATSEMERLVKKNEFEATLWLLDVAKGISTKPTEVNHNQMTALRAAWKKALGTKFADNIYEYYSLIDPLYRVERGKLNMRYDKAWKRYGKNLETKDQTTFGVLYGEFEGLAGAFADLGDNYYSSQSWLMAYSCVNEDARGKKADLYKCCAALKGCLEQRKIVDLKDRSFSSASTSYDTLKAKGYDRDEQNDDDPGGGDAPPVNPTTEGKGSQIVLSFDLIDDVDTFSRPSYYDDEVYNLWARLFFKGTGSTAKISSMGKVSPSVIRTASASAMVDTDGDGTGDLAIPMRGKIDPIEFEIGEGSERRKWGALVTVGTQADIYQNINVSMQPTDDQMTVYLAPAASMLGTINEIAVRIIDENMDGIYGSVPLMWGHDGMTKGIMHPEFDTFVIGDAKRALPWSEYQKIGDSWYRLEVLNGGGALKFFPTELETGKVKFSFKGPKPTWMIFKGSDEYENSYFDVLDKTVELPTGNYTFFCGEVRKGKKLQTIKSLIVPGEGMRGWRIEAGKTTEIEMGGPFKFDFLFDEDPETISVAGKSIAITGIAGERYERTWNCVPKPTASYRKPGAKKGSKPEKFGIVMTQEEMSEGGWSSAWFPKDLDLKKKGKLDKSELALAEKKNKLFGKIGSDWKE
ncbi:MAG: hypothetical protein ACI8X5_003687 [Planctomycetota bacterium]|jgi:hypothetical protein